MLGIAVYIFLMTFLARLPVNYPAVYVVLLAIPVLIDIRGVGRRLAAWVKRLAPSASRPRTDAAFALLVFVLGMHWLIVPQPESSADGLAMHLAIPVNISLHHMFTYRPGRIFWSVMPMGADWCYTMVYLLGGEYAARLLNFAMLLLLEALLYRAVRRSVTSGRCIRILALFASTSLVQLVTGSMYVENFLAAMVVGMVAGNLAIRRDAARDAFCMPRRYWAGRRWRSNWAGWRSHGRTAVWRRSKCAANGEGWDRDRPWPWHRPRPVAGGRAACLCPLVAADWGPRFPVPESEVPIADPRSFRGLIGLPLPRTTNLHTPFDLTFHSNRYYEGRPGSLGFQCSCSCLWA